MKTDDFSVRKNIILRYCGYHSVNLHVISPHKLLLIPNNDCIDSLGVSNLRNSM